MPAPDLLQGVPPLTGIDPDAVSAACAQIRQHCGWHIAPSWTETVMVRNHNIRAINYAEFPWELQAWLPSLYVTAVTGVTVDGVTATFEHHPPEDSVLLTGGWWDGSDVVLVTMTHGYTTCPPDVRDLVARLAKHLHRVADRTVVDQISLDYRPVAVDEAHLYRIPVLA